MTGHFQRIREQLAERFRNLGKPKTPPGCIPNADLGEILTKAGKTFPGFPVWDKIDHPRDNYFTIYIMPLILPLHESLKPAMQDLKNQMILEGVGVDQRQLRNSFPTCGWLKCKDGLTAP
jgi:hypothetical protein